MFQAKSPEEGGGGQAEYSNGEGDSDRHVARAAGERLRGNRDDEGDRNSSMVQRGGYGGIGVWCHASGKATWSSVRHHWA